MVAALHGKLIASRYQFNEGQLQVVLFSSQASQPEMGKDPMTGWASSMVLVVPFNNEGKPREPVVGVCVGAQSELVTGDARCVRCMLKI